MTKWLSIVEDQLDDVSELTSLPSLQGPRDIDPPALLDRGRGRGFAAASPRPWRTEVYVHRCRARAQGLLERMESQAGRVIATELSAILSEGGCQRLDEVGRERLRILCQDFHTQCRRISPGEEVRKLHARIQALEANDCHTAGDAGGQPQMGARREPEQPALREARLRAPTDRRAESWWNPRYWSIARPTDFCYGDCAWGIGQQPPHGDGPQ